LLGGIEGRVDERGGIEYSSFGEKDKHPKKERRDPSSNPSNMG
jgi:hypothetical protein